MAAVAAASLLSPLLPSLDLDSALADVVVSMTDTASWNQMPILAVVAVLFLVTRPGIAPSRRWSELGAIALVMLVAIVGNGLLNEHVVKPAFGIPRPNLVELAQDGALGPEYPTAADLYAVGDKADRRAVLATVLPSVPEPVLSDRVEEHWIHETGYSFPSGHSTAAVTFATLMVALAGAWMSGWRRSLVFFVLPLWAIAVVYSRPLLEVHTALDVIVGTMAGLGWGLAAYAVVRWVVTRLEPASADGA